MFPEAYQTGNPGACPRAEQVTLDRIDRIGALFAAELEWLCNHHGHLTDSIIALQSSRDALLLKVAALEEQIAELNHDLDLCCEEPDPNCACPGCSLAREEAEAFVKEALKPS